MAETTAGETLIALGEVWTVAHVAMHHRKRFASWLKARAHQEVAAGRAHVSPADHAVALDRLHDRLAAGAFVWGGPFDPTRMGSAVSTALDEAEAQLTLLQLLLEDEHGKVPAEKVGAIERDARDEVFRVLRECLGWGPVPNAVPLAAASQDRAIQPSTKSAPTAEDSATTTSSAS